MNPLEYCKSFLIYFQKDLEPQPQPTPRFKGEADGDWIYPYMLKKPWAPTKKTNRIKLALGVGK